MWTYWELFPWMTSSLHTRFSFRATLISFIHERCRFLQAIDLLIEVLKAFLKAHHLIIKSHIKLLLKLLKIVLLEIMLYLLPKLLLSNSWYSAATKLGSAKPCWHWSCQPHCKKFVKPSLEKSDCSRLGPVDDSISLAATNWDFNLVASHRLSWSFHSVSIDVSSG